MDAIVSMTGRLGTEVEQRTSRNGTAYARFRIAHTPRVLREGHWEDGETSWVSVRCYRQLADHAAISLRKGQPVLVAGKLRIESWTDEAGTLRERTVLDANAIGHDLNWGISTLRRMERARRPDEDPSEGIAEPGSGTPAEPVPEAASPTPEGEREPVPVG